MSIKILFVCLGNICRSPLAEGIMHDILTKNQQHGIEVDSAGTGWWHAGQQADRRSIEIAQKHGIDISAQRAREISRQDIYTCDLILCMDRENEKNIHEIFRNAVEKNPKLAQKIQLLRSYDKARDSDEVPDPYYDELSGFQNVYDMINRSCLSLYEKLTKTTNHSFGIQVSKDL